MAKISVQNKRLFEIRNFESQTWVVPLDTDIFCPSCRVFRCGNLKTQDFFWFCDFFATKIKFSFVIPTLMEKN